MLHKPVNVGNVFQFGNVAPMEQHYNSVIGNYVQDLNQFYQSDAYMQKANELLMYREDNYLDMSIYLIDSMDAIIGYRMQQYIMANPYIAEAYDTGLINGFTNGYQQDYYLSYQDRKNYENVMDGIVYEEPGHEDMYADIVATTEDDQCLGFEEQETVLLTWDYVKSLITAGKDPSELQETTPTGM